MSSPASGPAVRGPSGLALTPHQWRIVSRRDRFRVTVAGRRGGKTFGSGVRLLRECAEPERLVAYVAPTYAMAKRLMWSWLLRHTPREWIAPRGINRSDLALEFVNGSRLLLFGAQSYDSIRGLGLNHVEIDEPEQVPPEAWPEVIRPALSDKRGSAGFRGTPKGIGTWFYDLWAEAEHTDGWGRHRFTTLEGGWVDATEIEAARLELDERTFRQEYEASFEEYGGLVYRGFSDTANVLACPFNPAAETWMCWDFNAGERPMSVILVQRTPWGYAAVREFVYVNTGTIEMCEAVSGYLSQQGFSGTLHVTGDHAGHRRESSASHSDYQIILDRFGVRERTSPVLSIQDRVNALNSLFCSASGVRRLMVDPSCKALIRGLQRVTWKASGHGLAETSIGETDPTDALSYFAYNYHPVHVGRVQATHT